MSECHGRASGFGTLFLACERGAYGQIRAWDFSSGQGSLSWRSVMLPGLACEISDPCERSILFLSLVPVLQLPRRL